MWTRTGAGPPKSFLGTTGVLRNYGALAGPYLNRPKVGAAFSPTSILPHWQIAPPIARNDSPLRADAALQDRALRTRRRELFLPSL